MKIQTAVLLPAIGLLLFSSDLRAGSATWSAQPVSGDWNTAANWMPATVPNDLSATASFGLSNATAVSLSADIIIGGIVFLPEADAYTIEVNGAELQNHLTIGSRGIMNQSGLVQQFLTSENGFLVFQDTGTAGQEVVITNAGGELSFYDRASAGAAGIVNEGKTESAGAGVTIFSSKSSAGASTITNKSASDGGIFGGFSSFRDRSSAGDSTITSESGANTDFQDGSNAGNATLISQGGTIQFSGKSSGGTARIELFGFGELDLMDHVSNSLTIGSLEGDSYVFLGTQNLFIGSSDLSTTFSGLIQDGTVDDHGAVTKIGTGSLTLSGSNLYTGGTTVTGGGLVVANSTGSATGTGAVTIKAGTLGGSGSIAGAVSAGTGSGAGAFLAPAAGSNKQATLTIQSALTFKSDSTYTYTLKAKKNKARTDQVIAKGVTIESGAQFNFLGQVQGKLRPGRTFSVISNTASTPISGTFANLPEGAVISVGGNSLQASYQGGDGNDLTLTVVP
jgi:autotransporter-associated beta strand protein